MTTPRVRLSPEALEWLMTGATAVPTEHAVFRIEGPAAVDCLQGLVTCDVARPGDGHLSYGAVLTPKGMIITDLWILRLDNSLIVLTPAEGRAAIQAVFTKSIPPRLAQVTDQSSEWRSVWLIGEGIATTLARAGLPWPDGELLLKPLGAGGLIGRLAPTGPAAALLAGPGAAVAAVLERFQAAGGLIGSSDHGEAARTLQGFPALGAEIDGKTLPQEVRYDEVGGVSYTKGCYVGQETVARVHFRGHPNRTLRGIVWQGSPVDLGTPVVTHGREVGTITSLLQVGPACLGLGRIRREVASGSEVSIGNGEVGRIIDPPGHAVLLDLLP